MNSYTATVEVAPKGRRVDAELVDQLTTELEDYAPAIAESPRGFTAVTITVPATSLRQATSTSLRLVEDATGLEAIACEVMAEAEADARRDWIQLPELVSVSEAAELLGVSRQAVQQRIDSKSLPATRVGRGYVLPRSSVVPADA